MYIHIHFISQVQPLLNQCFTFYYCNQGRWAHISLRSHHHPHSPHLAHKVSYFSGRPIIKYELKYRSAHFAKRRTAHKTVWVCVQRYNTASCNDVLWTVLAHHKSHINAMRRRLCSRDCENCLCMGVFSAKPESNMLVWTTYTFTQTRTEIGAGYLTWLLVLFRGQIVYSTAEYFIR